MNDPLNHSPLPDDAFLNRIDAALRELDQPESDADIDAALATVDAQPLSSASMERILRQVRQSIAATASTVMSPSERLRARHELTPLHSALASSRPTARSGTGSPTISPASQTPIVVACVTLLLGIGFLFHQLGGVDRQVVVEQHGGSSGLPRPGELIPSASRPHVSVPVATNASVAAGETIRTGSREKRRVTLPDGSLLSINEQSQVTIVGPRRLKLLAGEVFVEVVPARSSRQFEPVAASGRFVVETPHRQVTALGTKFVVKAQPKATSVVVTQGQVLVSGVEDVVVAGQELVADLTQSTSVQLRAAKRSAYVVDWVKDLMAAAGSIAIPTSEHSGGTIVVVDPQGQEMKLSLRKFHIDVHIEDGFARTTIDQTYFNHTWQQLEGTFRFPLPADASLSRLAMYVNGTLMEGGMVERDHGRNVFEQIRHTRKDPALLEWVDGSTFQMRVFPLDPRQEKRILLSYTQRLPRDYGKSVYRFPAGHNLEGVREWSTHLRIKGAAGTRWYSPSHLLSGHDEQGDLLIDGRDEYAGLDRDLVVELGDGTVPTPATADSTWTMFEQDGFQYVMLRQRPLLKTNPVATEPSGQSPRHWVFLVENSADRNQVLAETQRQIVKVLLENVEHGDTFSIIRAGTQSEPFRRKPVECSLENIAAARQFLIEVAPIGALDLGQALQAVKQQVRNHQNAWIVHLGTGIPVLGERDETTLRRLLPAKARYVGVAVGKRWSKSFMETAANQSGGHVTQINPDEAVAWRAFDLLSTLNAPRLTEISVVTEPTATGAASNAAAEKDASTKAIAGIEFLMLGNSLAHGQELAAVARVSKGQSLPKSVMITGKLNGSPYSQAVPVPATLFNTPQDGPVPGAPSQGASSQGTVMRSGHLPRTWARLQIERLISLGSLEHKAQIIELSKAMYVMSPFTSLLVLETDAMYEQFKVDRGRKDHWAMYPAPAQIPVVADPGPAQLTALEAAKERLKRAEARASTAQANHERSVAEKRPAVDLTRLERLHRAEQADVTRIAAEVRRITRINDAAADPVRKAWKSVITRRSGWQYWPLQSPVQYWGRFNVNEATNWFDMAPIELLGIPDVDDYLSVDLGMFAKGLDPQLKQSNLWGWRNGTLESDGDRRMKFFDARNGRFWRGSDPQTAIVTRYLREQARFDGYWRNSDQPVNQWRTYSDLHFGNTQLPASALGGDVFDMNSPWGSRPGILSYTTTAELLSSQVRSLSLYGTSQPEYRLFDHVQYVSPEAAQGLVQALDAWISVPTLLRSQDFDSDGIVDRLRINENFFLPGVTDRSFNGGWPVDESRFGRFAFVPQLAVQHPLAGLLRDLPSYAFGLETWYSDRLAIMAKTTAAEPRRGTVDAAARRLIEHARSLGWEQVQVASDSKSSITGRSAIAIVADGAGRFVMQREVSEGLKEQVVNDGTTLWHLYPEIGLGAKRAFSRFHLPAVQSVLPWFVPAADDLVIGADVTVIGERTIRITSLKDDKPAAKPAAMPQPQPAQAASPSTTEPSKASPRQVAVELVFAESGSLIESRVIDVAAGKLLAKQTIAADGTVRVFDAAGKLLSEVRYERQPAGAPSLVPATKDLVVLPLPYRSSDAGVVNVPVNLQTNAPDYGKLSEDDALTLLATYFAESRPQELATFIEQRYTAQGDHRIGLAVLLASVHPQSTLVTNAASQHPNSPLATYLQQYSGWVAQGNLNGTLGVDESASPFLKRLCLVYNHYSRWSTDRAATRERPAADIEVDLDATLEFIRDCRSADLCLRLLASVETSLKRTDRMNATFARKLNAATVGIADALDIPAFGRMARVEWLLTVGDDASVTQAIELTRLQLADSIEFNVVPELNSETRAAFARHFKTPDGQPCEPWGKLVQEAADKMRANGRHLQLVAFARRCVALGEKTLGARIFTLAIKDQDLDAEPRLNLAALEYAKEAGDWEQAQTCVQRALANPKQQRASALWRDAAAIAHQLKQLNAWIESLDRASELEFEDLPKAVNLETFRHTYDQLFGQLEQRAEQLTDGTTAEKIAFARLVQRAATRWREIDVDDTNACHRTAKMLTKLGLDVAAWNYWTTPLAETPDQATVWQTFATAMNAEQRFQVADNAWSTAFACEPTNPEILLQHAQFLRSTNQHSRAGDLLMRIISGTWQPRFDSVKSQAQAQLTGPMIPTSGPAVPK